MEWISLFRNEIPGDYFYKALSIFDVPAAADAPPAGVIGNSITRVLTLLPEDIASGGDVTLLRIVGDVSFSFQSSSSELVFDTLTGITCFWIGLTQLVGPEGVARQAINPSPSSTASQEQNTILYQRYFDLFRAAPIGNTSQQFGGSGDIGAYNQNSWPIDIKVKRRWDRSQYRLVMGLTGDAANFNSGTYVTGFGNAIYLRGLFLTQGGI